VVPPAAPGVADHARGDGARDGLAHRAGRRGDRERLAAVVGRSATTVSRLWAWAQDVGLLARVEEGAPKEWLGTAHNRAAAFVFVAPNAWLASLHTEQEASAQVTVPVDQSGNHPTCSVGKKPLDGPPAPNKPTEPKSWPAWRIPETPAERSRAATALLTFLGLDRAKSVSRQRVHGLLRPWWQDGWCPIALRYAIHHDPHTHADLGSAVRGASDPLATIGARLARWTGQHDKLPTHLHGRHGDYLAEQATRLAAQLGEPTPLADSAEAGAQAADAQTRVVLRATWRTLSR